MSKPPKFGTNKRTRRTAKKPEKDAKTPKKQTNKTPSIKNISIYEPPPIEYKPARSIYNQIDFSDETIKFVTPGEAKVTYINKNTTVIKDDIRGRPKQMFGDKFCTEDLTLYGKLNDGDQVYVGIDPGWLDMGITIIKLTDNTNPSGKSLPDLIYYQKIQYIMCCTVKICDQKIKFADQIDIFLEFFNILANKYNIISVNIEKQPNVAPQNVALEHILWTCCRVNKISVKKAGISEAKCKKLIGLKEYDKDRKKRKIQCRDCIFNRLSLLNNIYQNVRVRKADSTDSLIILLSAGYD